jgi:hypothetical protein
MSVESDEIFSVLSDCICVLGFIDYLYCYFCNELSLTGIALKTKRTFKPAMSPRATTIIRQPICMSTHHGNGVCWYAGGMDLEKLSIPAIGYRHAVLVVVRDYVILY